MSKPAKIYVEMPYDKHLIPLPATVLDTEIRLVDGQEVPVKICSIGIARGALLGRIPDPFKLPRTVDES